jgi:serine/threonine-protein phosphatase 2A regulatory subunit B'
MAMMVSANVCRALPPETDDFDRKEEEEPVLEPAWPIVSSKVNNTKAAKRDQKF